MSVSTSALADRVRRFRGDLPRGVSPLGVSAYAPGVDGLLEGDAVAFSPSVECDEPAALAAMLPPPVPGALLIVLETGEASLLTRLLGRRVRVARAVRGAGLLLAGYRAVGGGVDPKSGLDLCWGEA